MNLLWHSVRSDCTEAASGDGLRVAVAELGLLALGQVAIVPVVALVVPLPVALRERLALVVQQARAAEGSLPVVPVPPPVLDDGLYDLVLLDAPVQLPPRPPLEAVEFISVRFRLDPVEVLLSAVLVALVVVPLAPDARQSLHLAMRQVARLQLPHPVLLAPLGLPVALHVAMRALRLSPGAVSVSVLTLVPPFFLGGRSRATVPFQHAPPHGHVRF